MNRLLRFWMPVLLIGFSSCATNPVPQILQVEQGTLAVDLQVSYPYKPALDLPEFPPYPQDMDWNWDGTAQRYTLAPADLDRLIAWRIAVEAYPKQVKIVYEYLEEIPDSK